MKLIDFYHSISKQLDFDGDGDFEAKVIIKHLLDFDYPYIDINISDDQMILINKFVSERLSGKPLQYLIGNWDFYDLNFIVGKGVLIPRPETEMIIDYALSVYTKNDSPLIVDLCSGSGCIGITLAKHLPSSKVICIEYSDEAIYYLNANIAKYKLNNIKVIKADVLDFDYSLIDDSIDLIVSNPPYVPSADIDSLQKEVSYEPKDALDGGYDGLDFYKSFSKCWADRINDGYFVLECGENQAEYIVDIFKGKYKEYKLLKDFNNVDRIVIFRI